MNRKFLLISLIIFNQLLLSGQTLSKKQFIKDLQEADSYFYYEQDYEKAGVCYKQLADEYPENQNLAAKLGTSYLNVDGKRSDALKFLKLAVKNVVKNDDEYTEYGEKAPLDTYLYLAIAYQQNDSLQKAIELFTEAKRRLSGYNLFSNDYINGQINNCKYAMQAGKNPLNKESKLFVSWLNDYPGASNPVLSKNDSVFVFTQKQKGKTKIFCSYKTENWKLPVDITKQLGGFDRLYSNSITGDGKFMVIYMDDGDDGNLYYSERKDSSWSKIKKFKRKINTIYWEAHGFITADGNSLYFSSNRPGGKGELDLWISEKDNNGSWKEPVNCGNVINTPYNENTPFFDSDNGTLLFSSSGHIGMGGYDVFRSTYNRGSWSLPVGLPHPLNNTTDNSFIIFNNRDTEFITSYFNEEAGYRNIYSIRLSEPKEKRIIAEGIVTTQDGLAVDPEKANILLVDARTGMPLKSIKVQDPSSYHLNVNPTDFKIHISPIGSNADTLKAAPKNEITEIVSHLTDTGMYNFVVNPGEYILYVKQPGYKTDTIAINLPADNSGNKINIHSELIPESVANKSFLLIKNILFDFNSFTIDAKASSSLDKLRLILSDYPDLKIEIAGYTDSKGTTEYNLILAEKRADAVIDYLIKAGISKQRLTRNVYGSRGFAAMNTKTNGSDNPEGRSYNRRVTFGIIDPKTGISIQQETFTPRHLRHPSSFKYSIVLLKSERELEPNTFSPLAMPATLFINSVKIKSSTAYIIGEFLNKLDAIKYLAYAAEKGFKDAYITTQYDLDRTDSETDGETILPKKESEIKKYTIQLSAARSKINMTYFRNIEGVKEIYSASDKYYRYITGEYNSVDRAKSDIFNIKEAGFKDAFIRNMGLIPK